MDVLSALSETSREELHRALERYLEEKELLISKGTQVLGSFVSHNFIMSIQDGTVSLLAGILRGDEEAPARFREAQAYFLKMGEEGALELVDDYIASFEQDQYAEVLAGLFPERQASFMDPYNRATEILSRARNAELPSAQKRENLFRAIDELRGLEKEVGGTSKLDVQKKIAQRTQNAIEQFSDLILAGGVFFLLWRIVVEFDLISVLKDAIP